MSRTCGALHDPRKLKICLEARSRVLLHVDVEAGPLIIEVNEAHIT